MLSFLNSSTIDSDDEKEKSSTLPKSDLDLYPPNLDENQLLEIEKLTADSLIDLINNVQKVWFPINKNMLLVDSNPGPPVDLMNIENLHHRTHHHLTLQLVGG